MNTQFEIDSVYLEKRERIIKLMLEHDEFKEYLTNKSFMGKIMQVPDPKRPYFYDGHRKSSRFTLLHKLVLFTNEYPILHQIISIYYKNYPEDINDKIWCGWTPLMFAIF